jgi:hypothetical protein
MRCSPASRTQKRHTLPTADVTLGGLPRRSRKTVDEIAQWESLFEGVNKSLA